MQNIFPPLLSIQQPQVQPPQMALQPDQDSPPNLELLMSTLAQQQNSASSSSSGIPNQLFEAIFANALSQSQGLNNLSHLDQAHLNSSDQSSPPISALAEDTSTVVSTPTSAVPTSVQQVDEDAANKFMAQLLRDAPANLLQQLPGQSQPTSPNLQDASQLLEQLQFMGLLTGNNGQGMPDQTELKNAVANGALDLASMFGSPSSNLLGPAAQLSQQQRTMSSDAYCSICDKHLCNRYFLKTHMLKKHNIGEPSSATTTPTSNTSLNMPSFQSLQSPIKRDSDWPIMEPSSTPNRFPESEMPFTQLSDPPAKMPRLAPITISQEDHSPLKSPNQLSTPQTATSTARFQCDTCDKDFDAMSSLLQHQLQNHQQNLAFPQLLLQQTQQTPTGQLPIRPQTPISSPDGHHTPQQQQTPTSQQHTPNPNNMLNQLLPGLQLPPAFQLPQLFNFNNLPSAFPFRGDLNRMAQELEAATNGRMPTLQTQPGPKTPKRQYTSTQRNFCDLCNKEVCNKYFLRTHMLKMHNIIIDENKSVIANIDTLEKEKEGGLSFRCDFCKIKFDTRQQLRDHKRDVHNVVPNVNSSTGGAGASSASSECDGLSKTPNSATTNPLGSFFGSQNVDQEQEMHHHLEDPSSSASSTAGTVGSNLLQVNCHFCHEVFSDSNKMNAHLMTAHYNELINEFKNEFKNAPEMVDEDDLVNQVAMQMARNNQMEKVKEQQKDATFKCTHCQREYTDANKFNDHLQLHISAKKFSPKKNKRKVLIPQKIKKMRQLFTCTKCQRRFTNRLECQNHILNHFREHKLASQTLLEQNENQTQLNDEMEEMDEQFLSTYMLEEDNPEMDFRCPAVDEVVDQTHKEYQKRHSKEEKHSHTSGSASPSSTHMPEGFFQPLNEAESAPEKIYQTQSFVMRASEADQSGVLHELCNQLLGTLPVRQHINRPFRLTFDFQPLSDDHVDEKPSMENLQSADV